MNANESIVIVVPVYKEIPTPNEYASLLQLQQVLPGYTKALVYPCGMSVLEYARIFGESFFQLPMLKENFSSRKAYSDMLMDLNFYRHVEEFEWMLIYQTDAWIFEDRLRYFIDQPYDYWGAPHSTWGSRHTRHLDYASGAIVGNGGFSLRRIGAMVRAIEELHGREDPDIWAEDRFFTEGPAHEIVRIPPVREAFRFSVQDFYRSAMRILDGALPMGAHQPERWWPFEEYDRHILPTLKDLLEKNPPLFSCSTETASSWGRPVCGGR